MTTRGCFGFHRDGVDKLTYNHSDSYPEGLGADIVEFVRQTSVEEMNQIFDRIQMVDEDKMATPDQCGWAYVINLTTNRLEIYKGYCNVKLVIEFPLDGIPENWLEIVGTVYGDED